jgi:hypothetical protein
MMLMNFLLTVTEPIDELAAPRSLLREGLRGKPLTGTRDTGLGVRDSGFEKNSE